MVEITGRAAVLLPTQNSVEMDNRVGAPSCVKLSAVPGMGFGGMEVCCVAIVPSRPSISGELTCG